MKDTRIQGYKDTNKQRSYGFRASMLQLVCALVSFLSLDVANSGGIS
jgi:hypothetical protein